MTAEDLEDEIAVAITLFERNTGFEPAYISISTSNFRLLISSYRPYVDGIPVACSSSVDDFTIVAQGVSGSRPYKLLLNRTVAQAMLTLEQTKNPATEIAKDAVYYGGTQSCNHQWKQYVGLCEAYEYCTACDTKKG